MASTATPLAAPRTWPTPPFAGRPALAGWVSLACRLVVAGVLAAAALSKIGDPTATVRAVRAYQIVPEAFVTPFAHALPWVELAVAVLLLVGLATRVAGAMASLLMAIFLGGVISVAARGISIDCGCFGGGGATTHPHYTGEIVRDVLLLVAAAVVVLLPVSRFSVDPRRPAPVAEPGPGKDEARRHKVAVNRYQAELTQRSMRLRVHALVAGVLVVLLALVGIGVGHSSAATSSFAVPSAATAQGGIVVGSPSAPHHVIAYEDPQCPICGDFEAANGTTLQKAVAAGKVSVEYRMMSFLGPESVRAVAALGAASQEGKFEQLRAAMFAHQPRERTGGYSVADLLTLGESVGLTDAAYTTAVQKETYAPWARSVEQKAEKAGVNGTPTVTLDGKPLNLQSVLLQPGALGTLVGVS